jgi:triosephosphate isomerase
MRPMLIAGNWKMNMARAEATAWCGAVRAGLSSHTGLRAAVCPPFPYLQVVGELLADSGVALGAQNLYPEPRGAFTGEVSAAMLVDLACRYCIVGHSERRHVLGESDALIQRKVRAALDAGLTPILCVGEQLPQREAGQTRDVVAAQVLSGIAGLTAERLAGLVFAYEPVWAIGTGRNATPQQAQEVHAAIRKILAERYNASLAEKTVIQYGGSLTPANAVSLLSQPDVDGALVGGASLNASDFLAILEAAGRIAPR